MKKIILGILFIILALSSFILGAIMFLWNFSKRDFYRGLHYIDDETGFFTKYYKN